ncbi:MAG TPA: hypothetical protein VF463_19915 [Sphingobium sp.]
MTDQTENALNLLLADCRQALFDAIKVDNVASNDTRFEIGRAVGLMGKAMDTLTPPPLAAMGRRWLGCIVGREPMLPSPRARMNISHLSQKSQKPRSTPILPPHRSRSGCGGAGGACCRQGGLGAAL